MNYEPEMGQYLFGQPHQEFEVPEIMDAALKFIAKRLDVLMWNIHQKIYDSPFSNTGSSYVSPVFEVHAYSWDEDEKQEYNFKWNDLKISWYKYLGRGMSANMEITPDLASECLKACLRHIEEEQKAEDRKQGFG